MITEELLKLDFLEREKNEFQEDFVLRVLKTQGFITRNYCLARYISRLSGIIFNLKKAGYDITGRNLKTISGTDYVYSVYRITDLKC